MPEILNMICCCGDCSMTWCMKSTTRLCADLHGLPFPAVPKTAVGIACIQNKAVFLSLAACLPVSSVILQQKDLWSQLEELKDRRYWPEKVWGQLWWLYYLFKCYVWHFFMYVCLFVFLSPPVLFGSCAREIAWQLKCCLITAVI